VRADEAPCWKERSETFRSRIIARTRHCNGRRHSPRPVRDSIRHRRLRAWAKSTRRPTPDDKVKVLDFGQANALEGEAERR
jgi:hypothetical protein